MRSKLILGTRGSKLAMAQAHIAATRLIQADPSLEIEIKKITTFGDCNQHLNLSEIGGKGIFIKELEQALLEGEIDVAVHSFKDITAQIPKELELCAFFSPESVCDVLISRGNISLDRLASGARIGTSSMRRRVLIMRLRPDLCCVDIRGNIDTRISRLEEGVYEGIVLSEAGLIRLGLERVVTQRFDPKTFFPAPGQGVIALQIRAKDLDIRQICLDAGDDNQRTISIAELTVLTGLGFDCRTALGVHSRLIDNNDNIEMSGFYTDPLTGVYVEQQVAGPASAPEQLGRSMCGKLLKGNG